MVVVVVVAAPLNFLLHTYAHATGEQNSIVTSAPRTDTLFHALRKRKAADISRSLLHM
jgi:hypothetical protein